MHSITRARSSALPSVDGADVSWPPAGAEDTLKLEKAAEMFASHQPVFGSSMEDVNDGPCLWRAGLPVWSCRSSALHVLTEPGQVALSTQQTASDDQAECENMHLLPCCYDVPLEY